MNGARLVYSIGGTQTRLVSARRCSRHVFDPVDADVQLQAVDGENIRPCPAVRRPFFSVWISDWSISVPIGAMQRILPVDAVLGDEAHRLVGVIGVRRSAPPKNSLCVYDRLSCSKSLNSVFAPSGRPAHRRVGDAGRAIAVHQDVIALAGDVEAADAQLQALRVVRAEVEAALEEQVLRLGVGDRAAGVQADARVRCRRRSCRDR